MKMRSLTAAGVAAGALILSGCAADGEDGPSSADAVSVVATTTIWGSVADQIVECAGVGEVQTLMPVGADPHDFAASSQDVARMVEADLVIANGLSLEEGLTSALASAAQDGATVVEIAPLLDPIEFGSGGHSHEGEEHSDEGEEHSDEGEEHSHEGDDPHVWMDLERSAEAATVIGAALAEQSGNPAFDECGATVSNELLAAHAEVVETLSALPAERRVLITDHDAFGYFAEAYDFEVAGVVIPGGSTLADPSSRELVALAETIRSEGVNAIFANTAAPTTLVESLAGEVGDVQVIELYVGSVGEPGSGAETLQGMMLTNAERISAGLAG